MAKDYDIKDIQAALDLRREHQRVSLLRVQELERKVAALQSELQWQKSHNDSLREHSMHLQKRLQEEITQHNDLYRALEERKKFDDWLEEAYPETIEQYKAVMKLVEFMEDPPKQSPTRSPFNLGFGSRHILTEKFKQEWVSEMEAEKLKVEMENRSAKEKLKWGFKG